MFWSRALYFGLRTAGSVDNFCFFLQLLRGHGSDPSRQRTFCGLCAGVDDNSRAYAAAGHLLGGLDRAQGAGPTQRPRGDGLPWVRSSLLLSLTLGLGRDLVGMPRSVLCCCNVSVFLDAWALLTRLIFAFLVSASRDHMQFTMSYLREKVVKPYLNNNL